MFLKDELKNNPKIYQMISAENKYIYFVIERLQRHLP